MTRALRRPCLDCGALTSATRCPSCTRRREAKRGTPTQRGYDAEWARLSRRVRAEQPWCSRCGRTDDLTVDHIVPGSLDGGLRVLCRSCHGAIGARRDRGGRIL